MWVCEWREYAGEAGERVQIKNKRMKMSILKVIVGLVM
jgi:hypothetical protein